jgi:hypothetical protein
VIGTLVRAAPRAPILLLSATAVIAVASAATIIGDDAALVALQTSIVALPAAAVLALDEPPLAAVPVSRVRRRAWLLAAALPALSLVWLALLRLGGVDAHEAGPLTLQLVTVTALSLAAGSVTPAALAFCAGRVIFGPRFFPAGTEAASWSGATGWWAGAACAGLLWLAVTSRD